MGVLDKILDAMKFGGDDYDEEFFGPDDVDDEEYEEMPQPRKGGLFKKDSFDYDEPEEKKVSRASNKVTPMRQPAAKRSTAAMEVCVIKPNSIEDSREITETLLSGRTVILNLEGLELDVAQRIIDFTSGSAYAIEGNLQKISNYIFLVTPSTVDISGDLQDLLGASFDVPSF